MDFELRRAREKLEKEQKERKEKAKLKAEKERKAKQEAIRQREAIESAQSARRLLAAEAEAKASEQLEESRLAGRGILFCRILEAVPFSASGDKVKLPPSCFTELSEQGAFDKGPLHLSLSVIFDEASTASDGAVKQNSRTTHAGVLEFTADEGSIGVPPHVWSNLFPVDAAVSPMVEVRYVWLPKGTYAKLQTDKFGFSDIPNHKAVLETSLRQHATLSEGDILRVSHGSLAYSLCVVELKPSSSVSVLETDIEVDIIGSEMDADRSGDQVLKPLMFGKSEAGVVEEGNYVYYKLSLDEETLNRVFLGEIIVEIRVEQQNQEGDTDLYISKHPLLFPTRHHHEWSSHDVGSKVMVLDAKAQNLTPGIYSIAIYGFKGDTKYSISATVQEKSKSMVSHQASSSSSLADTDTVECRNCKHYIPSRTIALHEAYCRRHNMLCPHAGCGVVLRVGEEKNHVHCGKCGLAFQEGEMEKHIKVFHEPLHCPCGIVLEKDQMVQHQSNDCPLRLITCRFCGDMVPAGTDAADVRDRLRGLTEHESLCGSRTAPCDSCGRSVMLKDMEIHHIAVHQKS